MTDDPYDEDHGMGESIYEEEKRNDLVEDDEMSPQEEGFMQGYDAATDEEDPSVRLEESDEEED